MAIVFSFILSTNAQHKRHYQERYLRQHKATLHNKQLVHHHSHHKRYNNHAPVCSTKPVINGRLSHNFQPRKFWIEGYHSYIPHYGYVWNDGYYTSINRGRVWVPTKFVQSGRLHRFQKIPGHYIYL